MMEVRHLTPAIGTEISGVELAGPIDQHTLDALRLLLYERGVLFFREQKLTAQSQLAFAKNFGKPVANPHPKFGCVDGIEEVSLVVNDENNPADINVWHSDLTYHARPATVCVLYCMELPGTGGDTLWASMTAAYDALSRPMKKFLEGLSAYHQLPLDGYSVEMIKRALEKPIGAEHPVVRRIPETGRKALFVNRVYTNRIEGLTRKESEGLLDALFSHAESPDFQVRFNWSEGAVAVWDNRSTQHFAVADYFPARRVMCRVALSGEPVFS